MFNIKIKNTLIIISLITVSILTGCGEKDNNKNNKDSNSPNKSQYETIRSEGASFDIRIKDKGEDYYYNPSTRQNHGAFLTDRFGLKNEKPIIYSSVPTDKPCVLNSYCGYSLVYDGHYVYDYECKINPLVSLTTISSANEFVKAINENKFLTNSYFNYFEIASENSISDFKKIDKDGYIQCEAEVSFITYSGQDIENKTLFHGYIILTEKADCQSMFFFGGLEGEFSKEELEHIKDSFVLDNSKFALMDEDLVLQDSFIDLGGKKITGSFPAMFRFENCELEDVEYSCEYEIIDWNVNEYHKIYNVITLYKLDRADYTCNDYFDDIYGEFNNGFGWEDGGDILSQDGKVWKKGIGISEIGINNDDGEENCSDEIHYVCIDGDFLIDIHFSDCKLEPFSEVIPAFEKALSTTSIMDGESKKLTDGIKLHPNGY